MFVSPISRANALKMSVTGIECPSHRVSAGELPRPPNRSLPIAIGGNCRNCIRRKQHEIGEIHNNGLFAL